MVYIYELHYYDADVLNNIILVVPCTLLYVWVGIFTLNTELFTLQL